MPRIKWDEVGNRLYETGVDQVVLYPQGEGGTYDTGVAWSGVTSINENRSGAEATPLYADNIKYLNMTSTEEFGATIEAYTSPDEFDECDGSKTLVAGVTVGQQSRKMFGLSYRTKEGNDIIGDDYNYHLHLVYGCKAAPTEKSHTSINDSPEAATMSWEVTTTPIKVDEPGFKPTSHIDIDASQVGTENMKKLEDMLYGESAAPKLPTPDELKKLLSPA